MPRTNSGGVNWLSLSIAGGAVLITLVGNLLSFITGGNDKLEKRVTQIESDLTWKYVTKEFAAKDMGFIDRTITEIKSGKVDKDIYEQKVVSTDRSLTLLRDHLKEMDRSINQTFNARDAFAGLQSRLLELERATRTVR